MQSTGNVGIGTVSPAYPLDVQAPSGQWKAHFSGPDGGILIGPVNSSFAHIYSDLNVPFAFNQNIWSLPGSFSSYGSADLSLQTNGTTRMTLQNSNGNVGIGTTSPAQKLEIFGANDQLRLTSAANGIQSLYSYDGTTSMAAYYSRNDGTNNGLHIENRLAGGKLYLGGNTSQSHVIVDNSGNVGIGTTSPTAKLNVLGPSGSNYASVIGKFYSSSTQGIYFGYNTTGSYGYIGSITEGATHDPLVLQPSSGNVGIGTTSPSQSLDVNGAARVSGGVYVGTSTIYPTHQVYYAKAEVSYAVANATCTTGRAIQVPQNYLGKTGSQICAADTASDGAKTTCTEVKSRYITVDGTTGAWAPNDISCETAVPVAWPWASTYASPNSRPGEWANATFIVCCN